MQTGELGSAGAAHGPIGVNTWAEKPERAGPTQGTARGPPGYGLGGWGDVLVQVREDWASPRDGDSEPGGNDVAAETGYTDQGIWGGFLEEETLP